MDMGRKMERIYQLDRFKTGILKDHKDVLDNVNQQMILQVVEINSLQEEVAVQKSLVDAEYARSTGYREKAKEMQKRAIKVEGEATAHQRQATHLRAALKLANERRAIAEEALNKILEDPTLAVPAALSTDTIQKNKNEDLAEQMKAKDLQIEILTTCFLGKEKALEDTIQKLKA